MAHVSFPVYWQAFRLPKRGHSADEYEDAYAANPYVGRFAVADGASESSFAALWAQLLVNGFTRPAEKPDPDGGWLQTLQKDVSSTAGVAAITPMQIDGNLGSLGGNTYGAGAGHLFWRVQV